MISFKNTLDLFEKIIDNDNIKPLSLYSNYSKSYQRKINKITRYLLELLSGNDKYTLIENILRPIGVAKLFPFNKVIYTFYSL